MNLNLPQIGRDYSWFDQLARTELIFRSSYTLYTAGKRRYQMRHMVLWYVIVTKAMEVQQLTLLRLLAASGASCCRLDG